MACVRTCACRGGSLDQLAPGRLPGGAAAGGRGPGETPARGAPYPGQLQRGFCWLPATPLVSGILLRRAGCETPAPLPWRQQKNGAAKTPRPGAEKKSPPPSFVLLVAQSHRKIILSSVVATSTFYARTRVRSRLRTQLFEKIVKNEKVAKSQQ